MSIVEWWLCFRALSPVSSNEVEAALEAVVGPPQKRIGEWSGDPRDGYGRQVTLVAHTSAVTLTVTFSESCQAMEGPLLAGTESLRITLASSLDPVPRMAIWAALRTRLAALGYEDFTLAESPGPIVLDLEARGESALAAKLRKETTDALMRVVPGYRHVSLGHTRPDDMDAVLSAYLRPEAIVSASFSHCGLETLPAQLARFPSLRTLFLDEESLAPTCLRGWSFAALESLSLSALRLSALTASDCVGFPALTTLFVSDSPLAHLAPEVVEVCTSLRRVVLTRTPLASDAVRLGHLRAAWPQVSVECFA